MIRISKFQLFTLTIVFEIGSTTLFALGVEKAKQDAWIAILVAMVIGFGLLWLYTELQKNFVDKNLAEIIIILIGKPLGIPLALLYGLYFIHISTLNLNEFGHLMILTNLSETPLIVILGAFMLVIFYILLSGLEVFARTTGIMASTLVFFLVISYVLIGISGKIDLNSLQPILGEGIKPVIQAAYPQIVNFPFGEMVIFLMYWCYVKEKKEIRKISYLAVGITGILLTTSLIVIISVLGVDYATNATIPLVTIIKLIKTGIFLDAFAISFMVIGGFYKMTIFLYGGILIFETIFKFKNKKWLIILVGIFALYISIVTIPSFLFQRWLGPKVTSPYINDPFQIIFPGLLLAIMWLKKKTGILVKSTTS